MSRVKLDKGGLPIGGIKSFGAEMPTEIFVCDGCKGEDVTVWNKEGVQHWRRALPGETLDCRRTNEKVCGTYHKKTV